MTSREIVYRALERISRNDQPARPYHTLDEVCREVCGDVSDSTVRQALKELSRTAAVERWARGRMVGYRTRRN